MRTSTGHSTASLQVLPAQHSRTQEQGVVVQLENARFTQQPYDKKLTPPALHVRA
jgi:hypothetical protein